MCSHLLIKQFIVGLLALAAALAAAAAGAVPAPSAPATSDGDYTVTYTPCTDCDAHWLEEQGADGVWRGIRSPATFADRPEGIYRYRAVYEYVDYVLYYWWHEYSEPITVRVLDTALDGPSLSEQLSYRYEVRAGDLDADAIGDLFVERAGETPQVDGTLGRFLLRGRSDGSFELLPVEGTRLGTLRGWPLARVGLDLRDVNIDGFADMILTGIGRLAGLSGALDQIVFAPGPAASLVPAKSLAVDADIARFARDVRAYLQDPDYFPDNSEVVVVYWTYYVATCTQNPYDDPLFYVTVGGCLYFPVQQIVVYHDYSQFDPVAVAVWRSEDDLLRGDASPDQAFGAIEAELEDLLAIDIGGWDIDELLGAEADVLDDAMRRGTELFSVLAGIATARADETLESEAGAAEGFGDKVILAGRRIIGFGPFHTVLEYAGSTISANDSDPRALFDGTLISAVNWPSDDPALTLKIATVESTLTPPLYWGRLLAADAAYDDDLPYDAIPSIGAGGYNSNSYTSGIINATNGVAGVPMTRFIGGELPVPAGEFY